MAKILSRRVLKNSSCKHKQSHAPKFKHLQMFSERRSENPPSIPSSLPSTDEGLKMQSAEYICCANCVPIYYGGTTTAALMRPATAPWEPHSLLFSFPFAHAVKIRLTRADSLERVMPVAVAVDRAFSFRRGAARISRAKDEKCARVHRSYSWLVPAKMRMRHKSVRSNNDLEP